MRRIQNLGCSFPQPERLKDATQETTPKRCNLKDATILRDATKNAAQNTQRQYMN